MTKPHTKVTSYRLDPYTLNQLDQLAAQTGKPKTEVIQLAIDRMFQQETKIMNKRIAIIKLDGDENAGVMTFFPLAGDQWWEPEDEITVHLHLVAQHDLTAAQENYLRSNAHVMMYEVTNESA